MFKIDAPAAPAITTADGDADRYLDTLARFPHYLRRGWRVLDQRRAYFGDPGNQEAGIRVNANAAFCCALLAADAGYGRTHGEQSAADLLGQARALMAYLTDAHVTGTGTCAGGGQWGVAWQSSWWTTRLATGARLIWSHLDAGERAAIERVVLCEADHLLPLIVPTGLEEDTKAEENAWDAEILATAVAFFPRHARRQAWWNKLCEYAFNVFSVAQDRESERVVEGRRIRDWVHTVNLHSDFTLENHGSYHFCYVASPLHSFSWASYVLRMAGIRPPDALRHHVEDVWKTAKKTFLHRRFAYTGGQDWARYTYGEYFIVPALVWLQDLLHDPDAAAMEKARAATLREEQLENDDGSFFGKRFTAGTYSGQCAKYETDCYANLGLAHLWRATARTCIPTAGPELAAGLAGTLVSPECGIAFSRGPTVFASFSWKTLTDPYPLGLFVPLAADDLAEWSAGNLFGRVVLLQEPHRGVWIRRMRETEEGFVIAGTVIYRNRRGKSLYTQELEFTVDAAAGCADVSSRFVAQSRIFVRRAEGLNLHLPNDRFNHCRRVLHTPAGSLELRFDARRRPPFEGRNGLPFRVLKRLLREMHFGRQLHAVEGSWINIDNVLGIVDMAAAGGKFRVEQAIGRNLDNRSLHVDRILSPLLPLNRRFAPGEEILRTRHRLMIGDAISTRKFVEGNRP